MTYLALGDSYTIGESVCSTGNYPMLLVDALRKAGVEVDFTRIVARTGWTTDELGEAISMADIEGIGSYSFVSLLIGVNNQYRGRSLAEYGVQFLDLLNRAVALAGGSKERVFVISIPDYAFTPFGQSVSVDNRKGGESPSQISAEIDLFNEVNASITKGLGVPYFDITPISRQGLNEIGLVASDGLHPSAKQYGLWVELIVSEFRISQL
jgi:lysophospholipase L1-like esterase